jgi:tetratricopeptide (TPR) repeat protein
MSTKEKEGKYREAVRYIENALEILRTKAKKKDRYYEDVKYVKMACGTAYSGVLLALDAYLELKGMPLEKKKGSQISVKDYQKALSQIDNKILKEFNTTYRILHIEGYYQGEDKYGVIREGMDSAIQIINKIRPQGLEAFHLN